MDNIQLNTDPTVSTPEPASVLLLSPGLFGSSPERKNQGYIASPETFRDYGILEFGDAVFVYGAPMVLDEIAAIEQEKHGIYINQRPAM